MKTYKRPARKTIQLALVIAAAVALVVAFNAGIAQSAPPPPETVEALFDLASPGREYTSQAGVYRANVTANQLPAPAQPITLPTPVWRVGVVTDGLYKLDYDTLTGAGVNVSGLSPDDVHLLWRGQAVSLDGIGTEDGSLDQGDAFIFYGEKFHGTIQDEKYTDENVYWLTVDSESASARMATRWVTPTGGADPIVGCRDTVVVDENERYWGRWTVEPGIDTTWFFLDRLSARVTRTVGISLTAPVATEPADMVVKFATKGENSVYTMHLSINGSFLGSESWLDRTGIAMSVTVPAGVLQDGTNNVKLYFESYTNGSLSYQQVYLDRIEIDYTRDPVAVDGVLACEVPVAGAAAYTVTKTPTGARAYDVTDPLNPVRLAGYTTSGTEILFQDTAEAGDRYRVEAPKAASLEAYTPALDLLAPSEGADQIILAPRDFIPSLQPLITQRENQGLRVRVVPVEDLYPLFNGGVYHPEAIRAFVAYAYQSWPGDPVQYLFLVGDGHLNFKGHNPGRYGEGPIWIPPYLAFDDPTQGEVPVDSRYGDIDSDGMPEVYVGRLPAETVEQVKAYIAKLLAYENGPAADWQAQALLIADNGETFDEGFDSSLERIAASHLDGFMDVQRVYMEDYNIPPVTGQRFPTYTQDVIDAWNDGAAMVLYAGHAAITRWGHEPILRNTELVSLTEQTKLPFLLSLDCWDGYYMLPPKYPNIASTHAFGEWLTAILTDSGAIANFAPAGLSFTLPAESLANGFLQRMINGERRLGPLTQAGREAIRYSYLSRIFTLLGDPAMALNVQMAPSISKQAQPSTVTSGSQITYTIQVTNHQSAAHVFEVTDLLPPHLSSTETLAWTPTISAGGSWTTTFAVGVAPDYAGIITNTARVTTAGGLDIQVVSNGVQVIAPITSVTPAEGGEAEIVGTDQPTVTVQVPPGAVTHPIELFYTALTETIQVPQYNFLNYVFDLSAYQNGVRLEHYIFDKPITLTFHYDEAMLMGTDPSTLRLLTQEGDQWVEAACGPYQRNLAAHRFAVPICHLSRFSLHTKFHEVYLPMV